MYQVDIMSRTPVYEQIIDQTEKFIMLDILKAGDKIPSVRNLSVELSVNPNTIQKAISELDRRGIIFSVPGRGSYVSEHAKKALATIKRGELVDLKERINELSMAGISREEVIEVVDEVYTVKEAGTDD